MPSLVHSYVLMKEWVAPLSTRASTITLAPAHLSAQYNTDNYSSYRHVRLEMDNIRPVPTKGCLLACADMVRFAGTTDLLLFCKSYRLRAARQ